MHGPYQQCLKAVITEEEGKQVQQWDLNEQIKTHVIDITQFEKGKPVEGNEAEGCVYDDENETIFISREGDKGIVKAFSVDGFKYLQDVDSRAGEIEGDPEGSRSTRHLIKKATLLYLPKAIQLLISTTEKPLINMLVHL